jgi:histidinol-phosphate aminotransferase
MIEQLIRPEIVKMEAYEWEWSEQKFAEALGLQKSQIRRFDLNTSPYTLKPILKDLAKELIDFPVNEYPDTTYSKLTHLSANYTQTDEDMIVIGSGADECLDIVAKTFLDKGMNAIIPGPTYAMFPVITELMGADPQNVSRKSDFSVDVDAVLENINEKTRLIFLCSPNNPTANTTPRKDIERLLEESKKPVLIDEAYYEFSGESAVDLTYEFENLVVLRTFSKAFSMAGMRVAFLVANRKTVQFLNKVRPTNSLCVLSVKMAQEALNQIYLVKEITASLIKERNRLEAELACLNRVTIFPSVTNFLLIRFHEFSAKTAHQELLKRGIITRDLSEVPLIENCLRITIRTKEDNDFLLESLKEILME